MKKLIINPENPNGVLVDLTAEEITQIETDKANATAEQQEEQQAKAQKEADALAGNNKLLELGLTQAQVTAMTGYTPPAN
jgi:FMN-dependent NADH-azoreductase